MNEHAFSVFGGIAPLARAAGVRPASAHDWRTKPIPAARCPRIEFHSGGQLRCQDLRPDVVWHRIPDEHWPGGLGRPLVDYGHELTSAGRAPLVVDQEVAHG